MTTYGFPILVLALAIGFGLLTPVPGVTADEAMVLETPSPGKISAANKRKLKPMIDKIAKKRGVDSALVHAVIAAESGYNPRAVSPKGAVGLMQLMPATASDYGVVSTDDLFNPKTNVDTGTRHLGRLMRKYKNIRHAVMAYNAGEGALKRTQGATYTETRLYAMRVIQYYLRNKGKKPGRFRELRLMGSGRELTRGGVKIDSAVGNLDPGLHSFAPDSKSIWVLESKD
jgi:soluble lytic murein transglycosylase-like protein